MNKLKRFEGSQNDLAVSLWGTREGGGHHAVLRWLWHSPLSCKKIGCGSEDVSLFEKRITNFTYLAAGATTHLPAARKLTQMTLQLAFECKGGWLHVCVLSASHVQMREVVGLVAVVGASVS